MYLTYMKNAKLLVSFLLAMAFSLGAYAQSVKVSGLVLDANNEPLIGAFVREVGTQNGTSTQLDGSYSLSVKSGASLEFSMLNYVTKVVKVEGATSSLVVVLEDDTTYLDATIVIGYGSAQKIGNIVGSVTAVTSEELVNKPSANIADALQGKVAGLQIFNTSGEPQSSVSLRLRGESSLNLSTAPLYILDGIPVSSGVFNSINPQDIESISVLKDASSTAIYGSRAANGVIFISTKKGRLGDRPSISFRVQTGISMLTNYNLEMMNSKQLLQFEEMCKPELADDPAFQAKKAFILGNNINFDWTDYHFTKTAPIFQADGSVRGATDKTNYYISYGYYSEKGTARANSGTQRFNVRSNVSTDITPWLQVGTNLALTYARYHTVTTGWYSQSPILIAVTGIPYETPYELVFNEDGTLSYGNVQWVYPWNGDFDLNEYYKYNTNDRQSADLMGQAYVLLQPIKGLKIRTQEAIDAYDYWSERVSKPSFTPYTYAGFNSQGVERYYQISSTNTIEYNTDINRKHFFTVLLGHESILKHDKTLSSRGEGLTDDRLVTLSAATSFSPSDQGGSDSEATFNSFFLNGNYNYDDRYFVDASVRHDGSSLFGANYKYATFYAVGAMWKIKNEKFMRNVRWVDDLKMNATYGTTGNSGMSSWYASLGLVGTGPIYNRVSGWGLSQVPNADLTWETVATLNLRLAGRVFDRLDFDFQWYNKASSNLIMDLPFSATTGHSSGTGNVAALVNRGVDLAVTLDLVHTRDLYWGVTANMNYNMNRITKLYQGLDELAMPDYALKYQVGYSSSLIYVQQRAGVDPEDGCPMWYLEDGTTTKEYNEAPMMFWEGHDSTSPWSGGFSTNLSWRNWGLNADFSWIGDRWIFMNERYYTLNPTDQLGNSNFEVKMLNMWTEPGQVTDIPKYGTTFHHDTSRYSNAAFLRMKNISLSYSLPKSLLEKTRVVSAAKVYVTGRNLLTVTGFEGYDPEVGASNATSGMYPNSRQIVFGAEITF